MANRQCEEFLKLHSFVSEWVKTRFKPFTIHDALKAYYEAGNPDIRNKSVVGAVTYELQKSESIYSTEKYVKVKRPDKKSRHILEFISKEYSIKQRGNRLAPYKSQGELFDNP
jgi:predicted porin